MRSAQQQLIHMVNQIGENNQHSGVESAAAFTSTHIQKFWARSMKQDIIQHLNNGGQGLSEISIAAIKKL
ncbi:MAG: formate dehydrogenase subunit delta [Oceanospirillaceae bacterium]|nr:formate dehydrogenase subunit delta [Oceanospirillaceae bacterium]